MPGIRLKLSCITGIFVAVVLLAATSFNYFYQEKLLEEGYAAETESSLRFINSIVTDMENVRTHLLLIERMRERIKEKKKELQKYRALVYRRDDSVANGFRSIGRLFGMKVKYSYHQATADTYFSRYLSDKDISTLEKNVMSQIKEKNGETISKKNFEELQKRARAVSASEGILETLRLNLSAAESELKESESSGEKDEARSRKLREKTVIEKSIASETKKLLYLDRVLRNALKLYYIHELMKVEDIGLHGETVRIISSDRTGEVTHDTGRDMRDGGFRFSPILGNDRFTADRADFFAQAADHPESEYLPDVEYRTGGQVFQVRYIAVHRNPATYERADRLLRDIRAHSSAWKPFIDEDVRISSEIASVVENLEERLEKLKAAKTVPGDDAAYAGLYAKYAALVKKRAGAFAKLNPYRNEQTERKKLYLSESDRFAGELKSLSKRADDIKSGRAKSSDDTELESIQFRIIELKNSAAALKGEFEKNLEDIASSERLVAADAASTLRESALYDFATLRYKVNAAEYRDYLRDASVRSLAQSRWTAVRNWIYRGRSETDLPEFIPGSKNIRTIDNGIVSYSRSEAEEYMWKLDSTPLVSGIGFFGVKGDASGAASDVLSESITGYNTVIIDKTDGMTRIRKNGRIMLAGSGVIALLSIILTFFFSGFIVRRINSISKQSGRVASGDLDVTFPEKGMDEIEDMAVSLNAMIRGLKEREELRGEMSAAGEIQKQLLPREIPETLSGYYSVGHFYRAMKGVGGDYYDVLPLDDHRILFCIADVSNHGVGPALVMSMVRAHLHGIVKRGERDLVKILSDMNRQLFAETPETIFVTCFVGIIDRNSNVIEYCSAGHLKPLVYHYKSGEVTALEAGGLPLGMDDNDFFTGTITVRSFEMKPGDVFFQYTDGVSEAMNVNRELFGDDRLRKAIESSARKKIELMVRHIALSVQDFTGINIADSGRDSEINDDIAMIAVKRMK
jgi:serine phosphatase RsbU (regulator of sigma subunit)